MNSLERSLIRKAGYDHGWEVVVEESPEQVILASALHGTRARVTAVSGGTGWEVALSSGILTDELVRLTPAAGQSNGGFRAVSEGRLGQLLHQAALIARTLPDEPFHRYAKAVAEELAAAGPTSATEVERLVRQRVGQNIYRESLMDYWGGACAVTGIAIPEVLRASHARPWAECATDAERLNVFNGFLLCAHLDALFDRHLMSFNEVGEAVFAPKIDLSTRTTLGLGPHIRLRWIRDKHLPFLDYHRTRFANMSNITA